MDADNSFYVILIATYAPHIFWVYYFSLSHGVVSILEQLTYSNFHGDDSSAVVTLVVALSWQSSFSPSLRFDEFFSCSSS